MMKSLLAIGLLISSSVFANQTDINTIEAASMQLNNHVLTQMVEQNEGYVKALASYRLSLANSVHGKQDNALSTLSTTITALETLVQEAPHDDEAWALLSQSYGLMIGYQPQQANVLGPKAYQAIEKAEQLSTTNPRITMFKGIMSFNTPTMYGGSKTAAIESLNQAIALFADDKNSGNYWGEAEAYVWRGLSYQAINDNEKAKADFEMALQIAPDFAWANMLLKNQS